jgi:hypothetical protein
MTLQPEVASSPYAPPAEPPKKKSHKGWWFAGCGCLAVFVIIIVIIVVVAMIGAFAPSGSKTTVGEGGIASTKSGPGVITSDPKEKFKGFLQLLGEGKSDSAYDGYTSPALRERGTKEEFAAMIERFPGLKDQQASSYVWNNEGETFTVSGELVTNDGTYTYEATMVLIDGSWLVDSFGLDKAQ